MNPVSTWVSALAGEAASSEALRRRIADAERLRSAGRVLSLRAAAGRIEGRVQGTHARPHVVELRAPAWTPEQWRAISDALARQARHYARLLAGQLPEHFDDVLGEQGLSLVPRPDEWRLECTCTEPRPCAHQIAVWLQVRERLDDDPYLMTRVRGRSREQLLGEIRDQRGGDERDRLDLDTFRARGWTRAGVDPTEVSLPPVKPPRRPAGPLRILGNPPGWPGPTDVVTMFAPVLQAAAERAQALLEPDAE